MVSCDSSLAYINPKVKLRNVVFGGSFSKLFFEVYQNSRYDDDDLGVGYYKNRGYNLLLN